MFIQELTGPGRVKKTGAMGLTQGEILTTSNIPFKKVSNTESPVSAFWNYRSVINITAES